MAKNEPSALQIILDELRALRNDLRIEVAAVRSDLNNTHARADEAHKKIEKYENRFWGWICGVGGLGAAGGVTFGEGAKHAIKSLLS